MGVLTPTGLLLNATLLPESLKDVGYSTHAVGKWHLGYCHWDYTPTSRGFDTFFGYYLGGEDHYLKNVRVPLTQENIPLSDDTRYGYDFHNNREPDFSVNGTYDTYAYADYVENLLYSRNPDDPMFLYLAFQSVHTPFQVPENYSEPFNYIGDADRESLLGMVLAMDEAVGRVMEALKATGHYDNSVIIFSSDNGGQRGAGNNWPLRGSKSSLWEGGTRAAGFVHSPLLAMTGFESNTLLHVTDWYKTLVGLAGDVAPENTDGFDQWEAITTGTESPRSSFVYNIDKIILDDNTTQINAAIRKGDYKLIMGDIGPGDWTPPPEGSDSSTQTIDVLHDKCDISEGKREGLHGNNGKADAEFTDTDVDWVPVGELEIDGDTLRQLGFSVNQVEPSILLYNVIDDSEERNDIASSHQDIVQDMLLDLQNELLRLVPPDNPADDSKGDPGNFDNVFSPGWCQV